MSIKIVLSYRQSDHIRVEAFSVVCCGRRAIFTLNYLLALILFNNHIFKSFIRIICNIFPERACCCCSEWFSNVCVFFFLVYFNSRSRTNVYCQLSHSVVNSSHIMIVICHSVRVECDVFVFCFRHCVLCASKHWYFQITHTLSTVWITKDRKPESNTNWLFHSHSVLCVCVLVCGFEWCANFSTKYTTLSKESMMSLSSYLLDSGYPNAHRTDINLNDNLHTPFLASDFLSFSHSLFVVTDQTERQMRIFAQQMNKNTRKSNQIIHWTLRFVWHFTRLSFTLDRLSS